MNKNPPDPREATILKKALEVLIVDLRAALKDFGVEPQGNALFPETGLSDLSVSHQQFYDPQHCDAGVVPKKAGWIDANQSDYPLKVAQAYWNTAQMLKGLLEVGESWSAVSAFGKQFTDAQKKMNQSFDFMDDTRPKPGTEFRTQAPQVVDQRTVRVAKIYKKFIDTMTTDRDPMLALRLSAANFSGGKLAVAVDTINGFKDQFMDQFRLTQQVLRERIGIYEARLNENLHVEGSEENVFRSERIRSVLQQRLRMPQQYSERVEQNISATRQFLESPGYREMASAEARVIAIEERLEALDNIVDVDLQQSITELEQEKGAVDSLYTIRDINYAPVIFSGEPASDVVWPMDQQEKAALKKEYDNAQKTLEESREKVEQKRAELNALKSDLRKELVVQREQAKKEAMPLRPSVNLSHRDIAEETEESLREAQEVLRMVVDQTSLEYRAASFFLLGKKAGAVFGALSDTKKSISALNRRLDVVNLQKTALSEILAELKGASPPISAELFSKIKNAMGWKAEEAEKWEYLKQSQGVIGRLGVMVRYSTAPIDQINQVVAKEYAEVEKEEKQLEGEINRYKVQQGLHQVEYSELVRDAETAFVREFQSLLAELDNNIQDPDLLAGMHQTRKDIEVMSEQFFGKNEDHQQLFSVFDQRYEALVKAAVPIVDSSEPPQDPTPHQRDELYQQYFGEKGLASEYIAARSTATLYKFKDKIQAAVTKKSDIEVRFDYLSKVSKWLEHYAKTGDLEVLIGLQGEIQQELRDEKKFPSRVSSMLKSKKSESEPDTTTLRGVLERLERDLKKELSRRFEEPQEVKANLQDSKSGKK